MTSNYKKAELHNIGRLQKAFNWLILASLIAHMFLPAFILVGLLCVVYIFKLAKAEKSKVPLIWAILALFPLLNLISLLVLSIRATRILKDAGLKVGMMGANKEQLNSLLMEANNEFEPNHKVYAQKGEAWECPVCGEINLEYYDVCRNCGEDVQRIIINEKA